MPDRLYLQNHHGVYRSDDDGRSWNSIADSLPTDFGFDHAGPSAPDRRGLQLADHGRRRPDPAGGACRVFRTEDAGQTWSPLTAGLPQQQYYDVVLRDGMCTDGAEPAGIYFGTRNGEVYASADEGDSWSLVAGHLPSVLCVRAAVLDGVAG